MEPSLVPASLLDQATRSTGAVVSKLRQALLVGVQCFALKLYGKMQG